MKFLLIVAALLFVVASVAETKPADDTVPAVDLPEATVKLAENAGEKTEGADDDDDDDDDEDNKNGSESGDDDSSSEEHKDKKGKGKDGEGETQARKRRALADNTLANLHSLVNSHQDLLAAVVGF